MSGTIIIIENFYDKTKILNLTKQYPNSRIFSINYKTHKTRKFLMKAIILAAGRGSRMGAFTKDKHKCLLKVEGKRLIDWQIEALINCGLKDIGIVTGYRRADL